MNSRIPARHINTPSPLVASSLDESSFSERGLLERNSGSGVLRSSLPTPQKSRTEGEIEKVKVFARIRPALRDDETPGALVWSEDDGQLTIFRPEAPVPQSDFVFDKVLGPNASQADVYVAAVSDVVADVLRGYNGTILAYGQTGAGKTYTLGNTAPDAIGMIPRAAAELFSAATRDNAHTYRITMSYIQIYMEMIQDLLNPTADNLPIREDAGGVFVAGACEVLVTSLEECLHYLELGEQNRVFAFTHLNAHSSRSHAVVMLTVVKSRKYLTAEERVQAEAPDQDGVVTQKVTVGKLYMVDLAGSERLKKSKSVGLRATEARSINLSLTMLGMCISARAQDSQHVPFRDSKLTRLLQESLGGNAKTSLILCLSDVRQHADESLQSLQFGSRAARVCNKPVVNERLQMRQLTAELLAALEEGNERTNGLEQALSQTKEERDALQAALTRERARTAAIVEALRAEARAKDEQAAAKLAEQAELISEHVQQLGQVQHQHGQLEMELSKLKAEKVAREEAHRVEVTDLQQRLAEAQAAAAQRQTMEAEARSQQARLVAAAQQQAVALSSQLAQERVAAREQAVSIHLALTRLQRALGELVSGTTPVEDGGGSGSAGGGSHYGVDGATEVADGSGRGTGGLAQRPTWTMEGLAAAAAAAASRRGMSSGSGNGDGSLSSGGSSAVQMIQAALGLTGSPSEAEVDDDGGHVGGLRGEEVIEVVGSAGPTTAAIAALVGPSTCVGAPKGGSRRRQSLFNGAVAAAGDSGSPRGQRGGEGGPLAEGMGCATTSSTAHHSASNSRRTNLGASALSLPGPVSNSQPNNLKQQLQHLLLQQQQEQQQRPSAARFSAAIVGRHTSDIADLDAALAAAQQDLMVELRAVAAASGSGSGSRSGSGSGGVPAPLGYLGTGGYTQGPTRQQPHTAIGADARSGGVAAGHDAAAGAVTAARQPSPQGNRSSGSGVSGSYAADYATAVANGVMSPGYQQRSYSQLHAGGAAAGISAAKPPRRHGHGGSASDGGHGGGLRHEASGASGGSTRSSGHLAATGSDHSLSTPFMAEGGRQAASVASPAPPSRNTSAGGACVVADGDMTTVRRCSGILNLNPAFDAGGSESLKSDDMLAAMSVAGMSFTALVSAAATASGTRSSGGGATSGVGLTAEPASLSGSTALLRERLTSADAASRLGLLAPSTTLAQPQSPPSQPLFTGIQVQLDALMDMAAVLKRVKAGLEARIVAQAFELAWRREQQHQSRGDLQAARAALATTEAQLAGMTQELGAVRLVLAETVDELGRARAELADRSAGLEEMCRKLDDMAGLYDSALMRLGETRGRLDEALGELDEQRGEVQRLESELEHTKAELVSERAVLDRVRAAAARSVAVTTQALAERHELQRQIRAANVIKAAFKRYKLAQLRSQVAAKHQALRDAEVYRREREAHQAARAGQALVQESVGVIQDAVGSILAAFVGRRYQLDARRSLQDRLERMMSQGGSSAATPTPNSATAKLGISTLAKLPTVALPLSGRRPQSTAGACSSGAAAPAASGAAAAASRSVGGGLPPTAPSLPITPSGRRQMSSPLGLTMMLSAVTLPPLTPPSTTVSAAASTSRAAGSVDCTGEYSTQRPRQGFPPPALQLPDDTATSASSATPRKAAVGSLGGGMFIRSSGGDGAAAAAPALSVAGAIGAAATVSAGVGGTCVVGDWSSNSGTADAKSRRDYSAVTPSSVGGGGVSGRAGNTAAIAPDSESVVSAVNGGGPCSSSSSCCGEVAAALPAALHTSFASAAAAAAASSAAKEEPPLRQEMLKPTVS